MSPSKFHNQHELFTRPLSLMVRIINNQYTKIQIKHLLAKGGWNNCWTSFLILKNIADHNASPLVKATLHFHALTHTQTLCHS